MDESDFEGTLVLERLAAVGKLADFFDAVDSDDFELATTLMHEADIDTESVAMVVKLMRDA